MPIDSGFDYVRFLSLDQAKLVGRSRINNLGSYEITLNYNKVTAIAREDCLEWLEANRLEMTDPTFSNKTYEGTWKCVSIAYDEDRAIIQQIFKIDSTVGDLGDTGQESDYGLQVGDLARISTGMRTERAYYWKVVNPEDVQLPDPERIGEIWTKTANDNGDGSYDVTVTKEVAQNLTALSASQFGGIADGTTDINVIDAGTSSVNGVYIKNAGTSQGKDYWTFGSLYLSWNVAPDGWYISDTLPAGGNVYYRSLSSSDFPPASGWVSFVGIDPPPAVLAAGGNGGPYDEETEIETNTDEKLFGIDVPVSVDGKIKSITNTPLENGKFRTAVTTRDAKPLRMPTTEGSLFAYADSFFSTAKALIVGRNRTYEQFTADSLILRQLPYINRVNNISVRINDFGLFDYTITTNEPG